MGSYYGLDGQHVASIFRDSRYYRVFRFDMQRQHGGINAAALGGRDSNITLYHPFLVFLTHVSARGRLSRGKDNGSLAVGMVRGDQRSVLWQSQLFFKRALARALTLA